MPKNTENLVVELEIKDGNADVVIGKNKQKLQDFVKDVNTLQPQISFKIPNTAFIDLDKLEKRAEETRKRFADITAVRLDNGQIGVLTKEIITARDRAAQLHSDISSIKRELQNPSRKSSIEFLTQELRAAEKEADLLNAKLRTLGTGASSPIAAANSAENLKLTSFQKQNLSYQVNDIATMAAMGANPTQILASQAGQIAQIFNPAQIAAFTAAYSGLVTVLGAGAVAIAATYKITGDMRSEAERLLKVQESIAAASNKQLISQQEVIKNYQKMREEAESQRGFDRFLSGATIDDLKNRRATLEKQNQWFNYLYSGMPNEGNEKRSQQILALDAQIDSLEQRRRQASGNTESFNQRWESYLKSQERMRELEEQRAKEFAQSVEKGKAKVKELEKTYNSVFEGIYKRTNSNNPFVLLFSEAEESMKNLRNNTRGLSTEIISTFEKMERAQNRLKLFETRLNTNLSVFDLRSEAQNFRSGGANDSSRRDSLLRAKFGNEAFDKLNDSQKREEYEKLLFSATPAGLNRQSLITSLAFDRGRGDNATLNERLEKQLKIVEQTRSGFGAEVDPLADRRIIALTNGLDPNQISSRVREAAAGAREREAVRQENAEKEAAQLRAESLTVQKQIKEGIDKLNSIAEKDGFKAVIEIVDKSNGAANVLGVAPTNKDVQNQFFPWLNE
ncbi:MAG: phage tail length tape measure family protein [Pyrinomonadaceae bacterium]|nr:phage tail length tape measure family protein [Pyrinomonadaceae bacterium]